MTTPSERARHGIRNRLLFGMGLTVVLGVFLASFVFVAAADTIAVLVARTAEMESMQEDQDALKTSLLTQETYAFDHALSGRDEALEEFEEATEVAILAYADLRVSAAPYPELAAAVEVVHETSTAWREEWAEPFLRSNAGPDRVSGEEAVNGSEVLFLPAEEAIDALRAELDVLRQATAAAIAAATTDLIRTVVPFAILVTLLLGLVGTWLTRRVSGPLVRLNRTAQALVAGEAVSFRAERDDEVGALAEMLERLRIDVGSRYDAARREGEHAGTFNQLAELTSFASDEQELVDAAAHALRRLVPVTRGDILLANPSQNRLTVGTSWGTDAPAPGSLVVVDRMDRCPGIRRASPFVADDVANPMAVRCPAHPAANGTVACVPMSALGKVVGVIHLETEATHAIGPELLRLVTRVAENVGLAMANARLMKTLEGLAMTDGLTGLHNARFFDPYLEQELEGAERDDEPTAVIMLDIDHFKAFNDAHGHPAGDEALRTFARVVEGSVRRSDVIARYGGEEFIVALHHTGLEQALIVAEKIRTAVEQMVVELGPGRYGRITASLGVASTDTHVVGMRSLVGLADAALYRAKESGRNRVEIAPAIDDSALLAGTGRRRRKAIDDKVPVLPSAA